MGVDRYPGKRLLEGSTWRRVKGAFTQRPIALDDAQSKSVSSGVLLGSSRRAHPDAIATGRRDLHVANHGRRAREEASERTASRGPVAIGDASLGRQDFPTAFGERQRFGLDEDVSSLGARPRLVGSRGRELAGIRRSQLRGSYVTSLRWRVVSVPAPRTRDCLAEYEGECDVRSPRLSPSVWRRP